MRLVVLVVIGGFDRLCSFPHVVPCFCLKLVYWEEGGFHSIISECSAMQLDFGLIGTRSTLESYVHESNSKHIIAAAAWPRNLTANDCTELLHLSDYIIH